LESDSKIFIRGNSIRLKHLAVFAAVLGSTCALSCSPTYAQQQSQQPSQQQTNPHPYPELPAGPGKDTLIRVCSKCHSPDNVIANGQTRQGWENTISKMATLGAPGSDDDFNDILDYLVKNFPPPTQIKVNVNKATAKELATGLSLSSQDANAIVHYREVNGDFKSIEDLEKVSSIDVKKLEAEKTRLTF
jgi:competence protein ComEA